MPEHTPEEQAINRIREETARRKREQLAKGAEGRKRVVRGESDLQRAGRERRTRAAAATAAAERAEAAKATKAKDVIQEKPQTTREILRGRQEVIERLIEGQTTDSNNQ